VTKEKNSLMRNVSEAFEARGFRYSSRNSTLGVAGIVQLQRNRESATSLTAR
jgi:hypothetical protein